MYRKQMKLQRVLCLLSIVASAVVFIYSLGLMTDLNDMLNNPFGKRVAGAAIYEDMQGFNRLLTRISIGLILISCLLFVTNTHSRRKYYIGNYFAIGLTAVVNIGAAVWAHTQVEAYKTQYLTTVDQAQLQNMMERSRQVYYEGTFWFDAHYAVFALTLCVTVLPILNAIWKRKLMSEEKSLLTAGKAATV